MPRWNPALQRPLVAALDAGDFSGAERALAQGAVIDWPAVEGGPPPLVAAARRGDAAAVGWLLDHSASPHARQGIDPCVSAIEAALENGHDAVARTLLSTMDGFDASSCEAAALALARGPHDDPAMLAALCDAVSRPPALSPSALARVLDAAAGSGHERLCGAMIERGARPISVHGAARAGRAALVRLLAAHGASVNEPMPDTGETPLHSAVRAQRGGEAVVDALLGLACRVDACSRDGLTPAALARALGRPALAGRIERGAAASGPTWMREARERGIDHYVFLCTRAHGLGFDPKDVEKPVLWGGDYEGFGWPLSAREGLEQWHRLIEPVPEARDATRWFVPFMERLARAEDFGLDALENAGGRYRIEREPP
ncbi:MAG: ankyrin repeat domain-containing protein [Burkholderiaceae bacterium]